MSSCSVFALPAAVLHEVLGGRLALKDLVRLDSACCHRQQRNTILSALAARQFKLHCSVNISDATTVQWLQARQIRALNVEFRCEVLGRSVVEYLRNFGSHVRSVQFQGKSMLKEMGYMALNCRNLTLIKVTGTALTNIFNEILWYNPNIEELWFIDVESTDEGILAGVSLNKLKNMHVENCKSTKGFPWSDRAFSTSLLMLEIINTGMQWRDFRSWAQNCPNLKSLSYRRVNAAHDVLSCFTDVAKLCNMSIQWNRVITDACVLSICKGLSRTLRSLNLSQCTKLTNGCLQYIAEQCGNTLEVLHIDIKAPENPETERALEVLSQKCNKLRVLNIDCGEKMLCMGAGTSIIALGCSALQVLVVNKYATICASSRRLVTSVRKELKICEQTVATTYDIMFMPI